MGGKVVTIEGLG